MAATTETAWTAARTLDELKRYFRLSDQAIADRCPGYTRDKISERRRGVTALDSNDMDVIGHALGVPSTVFLLTPTEALRWLLDHDIERPDPDPYGMTLDRRRPRKTNARTQRDQGKRVSGCTPELADIA